MTSRLASRLEEHRNESVQGFTARYRVHRLVWCEPHECAYSAISREKQIKKWNRAWKIEMIERENPYWNDLADMVEE